jgi:hypothetical protein
MKLVRTTLAVVLVALASGCKQPADQEAPVSAGPVTSSTAIERIVFVDMSDPCDCTRKKIDNAQKALDEASGAKTIHVDRLHLETDDEKIDVYRDKQPFMVVPALYFVDDAGNVLTLLQGDITAKQVEDVISSHF